MPSVKSKIFNLMIINNSYKLDIKIDSLLDKIEKINKDNSK
jgi:hypothetical protein